MVKIKRSHDHIIFNIGIPIPGNDALYWEGVLVAIAAVNLPVSYHVLKSLQRTWKSDTNFYLDDSGQLYCM